MTGPRVREVIEGIGVSPGYAIGRAHLVDRRVIQVPRYHLSADQIRAEIERFRRALSDSEGQLSALQTQLGAAGEEHAIILGAHILILRDVMLVDGTEALIQAEGLNAEWALEKTLGQIRQVFEKMEDEYFRERREDVKYVGDRVMRNLLGTSHPSLSQVGPGEIIVAHDLSPADTAFLLQTAVQGFATDVGGKTSHTAIMARSLEIPAVVALERITEFVGAGDTLVVDGVEGRVLVNPSRAELRHYQKLQYAYSVGRAKLAEGRNEAAQTTDGAVVAVHGNIELPDEAEGVFTDGAEGIGLFRTEYLYMNRPTLPSEEEQYAHYCEVLNVAGRRVVTIRTMDIGGDKLVESLKQNPELNPVLGLRAVRLCLKEPEIFRVQLRALLRASAHGRLRIMVPLISGLEEVRAVQALLSTYKDELRAEGYEVGEIPLGIMVELPSAAMIADLLAAEVDFFSIGTNDLIQYTLAIDRANEHVAHLYHPLHPAMLRMLEAIVAAADAAGIPVSMCGEMAGDAFYVPVLLGLGLRTLSMNVVSIPLVKSVVRAISLEVCQTLFAEVRAMSCTHEIEAHVAARLGVLLGDTISSEQLNLKPH